MSTLTTLALAAHFAEQLLKLVKKITKDAQRARKEEEPGLDGDDDDEGV